MNICIITGSSGLIGSESVSFFAPKFDKIIGIDNNMRQVFFGADASTEWNTKKLTATIPNFEHHPADIRNIEELEKIFSKYGSDIKLVIHTAAQPSHDWAANEPITDFTVNANVTLNLLEATRLHFPKATFIFT
jgi:CDP-paratose 2-epimerase